MSILNELTQGIIVAFKENARPIPFVFGTNFANIILGNRFFSTKRTYISNKTEEEFEELESKQNALTLTAVTTWTVKLTLLFSPGIASNSAILDVLLAVCEDARAVPTQYTFTILKRNLFMDDLYLSEVVHNFGEENQTVELTFTSKNSFSIKFANSNSKLNLNNVSNKDFVSLG